MEAAERLFVQQGVEYAAAQDPGDRRRSLIPRVITTNRTDADPRYVDLSIEVNDRHYGSLFGRRPDLTNYGLVGFGRCTTPAHGCPPDQVSARTRSSNDARRRS